MPREAARLPPGVRRHVVDARRARVARGLVGDRPRDGQPAGADARRARRTRSRCTRTSRSRRASSRSCFSYDGPRRKIVMTRARVPVEPLPLRGLPPLRRRDRLRAVVGSDPARPRALPRRDRRADAARAAVAGAVQERLHHRRARGDREGAPRSARTSSSTSTRGPAPCRWISRRWGADFAVGGSVKWLCGGPGAGYLYVRPDLAATLEPGVHRLGGARVAVRVRHRPGALRRRARSASRAARRTCRRSIRRAPATRSSRRSASPAIRARSLRADAPAHRRGALAAGFRLNTPTDDHERGGSVILDVPERRGGRRRADPPRRDRRLPSRRRHPHGAALLQHRGGDRSRDRRRCARSWSSA